MKKTILLSAFLMCTVLVSYGQWTTTYLTDGTIRMGASTLGNKAYFAGGAVISSSNWVDTDKVEIYDMETGTWQMDYLSEAREYTTGVSGKDKVFFAGGMIFPVPTSKVDMFDSWGFLGSAELSVPRFAISAVSNDSLVLFAGGANAVLNINYDVVDIYNIMTDEWSTDQLSEPRGGMGSAVAGDLAFFAGGDNAGGFSARVDIYHFSTGTWDTASLSLARNFIGATTVQNKVIFAGGMSLYGPTNRVDIYNTESGEWTTASLSLARGFFNGQAVTVCGKAYFVGNGTFNNGWDTDTDTIDVYDPVADTWSVMTMPNRLNDHSVVVIDSSMLIAGGWTYTTYPYGEPQKNVEIYKDSVCAYGVNVGIITSENSNPLFRVYPNPSAGHFNLELINENHRTSLIATLYNIHGQVVFTQSLKSVNNEFSIKLPDGIYLLNCVSDNASQSQVITIKN
jgi:hypothetical protein